MSSPPFGRGTTVSTPGVRLRDRRAGHGCEVERQRSFRNGNGNGELNIGIIELNLWWLCIFRIEKVVARCALQPTNSRRLV